jgi:hypothetical protein
VCPPSGPFTRLPLTVRGVRLGLVDDVAHPLPPGPSAAALPCQGHATTRPPPPASASGQVSPPPPAIWTRESEGGGRAYTAADL